MRFLLSAAQGKLKNQSKRIMVISKNESKYQRFIKLSKKIECDPYCDAKLHNEMPLLGIRCS